MIPDFKPVMFPLLQDLYDSEERSLRELVTILGDELKLTEEERSELLPSDIRLVIYNRCK